MVIDPSVKEPLHDERSWAVWYWHDFQSGPTLMSERCEDEDAAIRRGKEMTGRGTDVWGIAGPNGIRLKWSLVL